MKLIKATVIFFCVMLPAIVFLSACGTHHGSLPIDALSGDQGNTTLTVSTPALIYNYCSEQAKDSNFACEDGTIKISTKYMPLNVQQLQQASQQLQKANQSAQLNSVKITSSLSATASYQLLTDDVNQPCTDGGLFYMDESGYLRSVDTGAALLMVTGTTVQLPLDTQRLRISPEGFVLVSMTNSGAADYQTLGQIATGRCDSSNVLVQAGNKLNLAAAATATLLTANLSPVGSAFDSFLFCDKRFNWSGADVTDFSAKLNIDITGSGYLILYGEQQGLNYYTRANTFYVDSDNIIRESISGFVLLDGSSVVKLPFGSDTSTLSLASDGGLWVNVNGVKTKAAALQIATFVNPTGLALPGLNSFYSGTGNITYSVSSYTYLASTGSGTPLIGKPNTAGRGDLKLVLGRTQNMDGFEKARIEVVLKTDGYWFPLKNILSNIPMVANSAVVYTKSPWFIVRADNVIANMSTGLPLLGADGNYITIPSKASLSSFSISDAGVISVKVSDVAKDLGQINLVSFADASGLVRSFIDSDIYAWTSKAGLISTTAATVDKVIIDKIGLKISDSKCTIAADAIPASDSSLSDLEILDSTGAVCGTLSVNASSNLQQANQLQQSAQSMLVSSVAPLQRLSTGKKVNSGSDNAAGLSVFSPTTHYYTADLTNCSCVSRDDNSCGFQIVAVASDDTDLIQMNGTPSMSGSPLGTFSDATYCRGDLADATCMEFGSYWDINNPILVKVTAPNGNTDTYVLDFAMSQQVLQLLQ